MQQRAVAPTSLANLVGRARSVGGMRLLSPLFSHLGPPFLCLQCSGVTLLASSLWYSDSPLPATTAWLIWILRNCDALSHRYFSFAGLACSGTMSVSLQETRGPMILCKYHLTPPRRAHSLCHGVRCAQREFLHANGDGYASPPLFRCSHERGEDVVSSVLDALHRLRAPTSNPGARLSTACPGMPHGNRLHLSQSIGCLPPSSGSLLL